MDISKADALKSLLFDLCNAVDSASHKETRSGKAHKTLRAKAKSAVMKIAKTLEIEMTDAEANKIASPWI